MYAPSIAKKINEAVVGFEDTSKRRLAEVLTNRAVPMIIETILASYDLELSAVISRDSRTNPVLYRDLFQERLEAFEFVAEHERGLVLHTPDDETFDFSGRLKIIERILNGTAGIYIEVDEGQYVQM